MKFIKFFIVLLICLSVSIYAVSTTLVVSEVFYNGYNEPGDEWIEIYNLSSNDIALDNYKIGDEETQGGGEGMAQFPAGSVISAGTCKVIANRADSFYALYGFYPDFEFSPSVNEVPDMIPYTSWATGDVNLSNNGDQVLILDQNDQVVDVVVYGNATYPDVTPHPGVSEGSSIERCPAWVDTDDCSADFYEVPNNGSPSTPCTSVPTPTPTPTVLPTMNVWHIPTNQEPPTVNMRNPLYPEAGQSPVYIYCGGYPQGTIWSGILYYKSLSETSWHQASFYFDSNNGPNEYWVAQLENTYSSGTTVQYYLAMSGDPNQYADTYVYGDDYSTNTTRDETEAQSNPYTFTLPGNTPTPTITPTEPPTTPTPSTTPALLISEVYYDPLGTEPDEEWVEIYNRSSNSIQLDNFKVGDEETQGGTEGMYQFPAGYSIAPNSVIVIANKASAFYSLYGFYPDFEFNSSEASVPDMTKYTAWSTGNIAFGNSGDQVLILNANDVPIDVVVYENASYEGVIPHPGVSAGHTIARCPAWVDTNDCSADFYDFPNGGTPGEACTTAPTATPTSTPETTTTPFNSPTPSSTQTPPPPTNTPTPTSTPTTTYSPTPTTLPLMNVWHIPTNEEPPSVTMRNPTYPGGGQSPVYIYCGGYPQGTIWSGILHYKGDNETTWHTSTFQFDSNNGSNEYWVAELINDYPSLTTVQYYLEMQGDPTVYITTYIYGDDYNSYTTAEESIARDNSFSFVVGGAPSTFTPIPTSTQPPSTPTQTPPPITYTPPPYTPTLTPTMPPSPTTPPPTGTPTPTLTPTSIPPTETPTSTPIPPTNTPTPTTVPPTNTPTVVPTNTPTPCELGVDLVMPSDYYRPGDICWLKAYLCNPGPDLIENIRLFVLLDIGTGEYWFYPSWTHYPPNIDSELIEQLDVGTTEKTIIEEFTWPSSAGSMENISFIGAMTDYNITQLIGKFDTFVFSFGY